MATSWAKSGPNRYERATDSLEAVTMDLCLSAAAFDREHWHLSTIAEFHVRDAAEDEIFKMLQNAWLHLRLNHPAVAVTAEGKTLVYETVDQAGAEEWVSSTTFFVDDQSVQEYHLVDKPQKYNTLHYFTKSSQVLIRMHHWLLDGTGGVALMDKLFRFMTQNVSAKPRFGEEWKYLMPSLTEAIPLPREPTPAMKAVGDEMFASYVSNMPSIGLPYKPQALGGTKTARISKANGFGDKLRSSSRAKGSSVTATVHAAMILATRQMGIPELAKQNYTSLALFNYRSYFPAPYNDVSSWPTGTYLAIVPFTIPPSDFAAHIKALYEMYHQPLRREESHTIDGVGTFLERLGAMAAQPMPPGTPFPSQPQLSGLGVLDRYIKTHYEGAVSLDVKDVEVRTDQMTPMVLLTQWSFNGIWHLSAAYNENFYDESFIDEFLDKTFNILVEGLAIDMAA